MRYGFHTSQGEKWKHGRVLGGEKKTRSGTLTCRVAVATEMKIYGYRARSRDPTVRRAGVAGGGEGFGGGVKRRERERELKRNRSEKGFSFGWGCSVHCRSTEMSVRLMRIYVSDLYKQPLVFCYNYS